MFTANFKDNCVKKNKEKRLVVFKTLVCNLDNCMMSQHMRLGKNNGLGERELERGESHKSGSTFQERKGVKKYYILKRV